MEEKDKLEWYDYDKEHGTHINDYNEDRINLNYSCSDGIASQVFANMCALCFMAFVAYFLETLGLDEVGSGGSLVRETYYRYSTFMCIVGWLIYLGTLWFVSTDSFKCNNKLSIGLSILWILLGAFVMFVGIIFIDLSRTGLFGSAEGVLGESSMWAWPVITVIVMIYNLLKE